MLVNTSRAHQCMSPNRPETSLLDKVPGQANSPRSTGVVDRLSPELTPGRLGPTRLASPQGAQKPRRGARTTPGAPGGSKAVGGLLGAHRPRGPTNSAGNLTLI